MNAADQVGPSASCTARVAQPGTALKWRPEFTFKMDFHPPRVGAHVHGAFTIVYDAYSRRLQTASSAVGDSCVTDIFLA